MIFLTKMFNRRMVVALTYNVKAYTQCGIMKTKF
jgi:hypothetical protein